MDEKADNQESWQDITQEFKDACSKLELGEIIRPNSFTLLEAMSAIELMDPKMDSGLIPLKTNREILSLDQSIKSGSVKVSDLELHELIGIIDDTYACISTWLDGHPLVQTVMTNLYLHDTDRIEDKCLRVFCQTILKLVEIIDRTIGLVHCVEEEDFALNNGVIKLAEDLNDQKLLTAIEEICNYYEKIYADLDKPMLAQSNSNITNSNKHKKKHQEQQRGSNGSQTPTSKQSEINRQQEISAMEPNKRSHLAALIARLRFTHNIYACFFHVSKDLLKDHFVLPSQNAQPHIQKLIKTIQRTATTCDHHLENSDQHLNKWLATIDYGLNTTSDDDKDVNDDLTSGKTEKTTTIPSKKQHSPIMGFEPLINHKLIPPGYPRNAIIKTRPQAVSYFKDLITKLRRCVSIQGQYFNQSKSFIVPLEAIEKFSKYYRPKSCVLSRSFLQLLYLPNRILSYLKEEIYQSVADFCEPSLQIIKADEQKLTALDEIVDECSKLIRQIATIYGYNPVSQSERFSEIIAGFRLIQYSAFLACEFSFKDKMLYSWTTYYFMRFCIKHVLSGFELELYSAHEYPYIFWYLHDILLRNEKEHLEESKKQMINACESLVKEGTLGKMTKTKVKKKLQKLDNQMKVFHNKKLLLNQAFSDLFNGLFIITFKLRRKGVIKSFSQDYTSEQICFDNRFSVLTGDSSIYTSYIQCTQLRFPDEPNETYCNNTLVSSYYREACNRLTMAANLFTECASNGDSELGSPGRGDRLIALCKANKIMACILMANPDAFANKRVEFCFDKYPSIPVIKFC